MNRHKNLAARWNEPTARAFRDAMILASGPSALAGRRRQWQRYDVVRALYALSDGATGVVVDLADLLSASGMEQGQVYNTLDSLEQDGALRTFNGDCAMLLEKGKAMHERQMARPYRSLGDAAEIARRGRPGLVATVPPPEAKR